MALEIRRPTVPTTWLLPLLVVNLFVINLGLSISDYPSTKLWQDIICKHYLGLTSSELLPERECHDRAVQRELNIVDIGSSVSSTIGSTFRLSSSHKNTKLPIMNMTSIFPRCKRTRADC